MSRSIFRLPLCWLSLCQTFRTNSDETGCWGECQLCGKRVGFVDRATLRAYCDAEERASKPSPLPTSEDALK